MQYVRFLITLVSLVFSFSAVYQWIRLIREDSPFILKILKCSFNKRNCIVDKSLKIIKLIKNAVRLKYNMNMKYNPMSHSDSVTKFQGILYFSIMRTISFLLYSHYKWMVSSEAGVLNKIVSK
jgi:1,4-dihydroxy-2-naphthoyl-CoA synthase